ncbi:PepSY-associated TM helix domain-containing protein [Mangrovicoccus algicola]|uniref:PepSY domain-containing protein n=1 Tax=Mangrovicoccus algicola TaxID=2771008 RepID=A0A8J7CGW5_9RHOB|nr:PepSY domain-containing protein [Mangrovicoccus algicola]MBE3637590.1 PepSY domain-containing protein [Mangrovicoccus algicola]
MSVSPPGALRTGLYRAVWRWHFVAGLLVLPFLILLAVTGAIYLFKDEINDAAYRHLHFVAPQAAAPLPASALSAAALEAHPGTLRAYLPAAAPDRSARIRIRDAEGVTDTVYVDPYDATVLGSLWDAGFAGSPAMHVVRKLHSLEYVGWFGNRLVELAAGWMILLVGTGIYLWWPRGRNVGVLTLRRRKGRGFWRDLHAVGGLYLGGFIVFLAVTGLPWSGVFGKQFYDLSYRLGLGMPDGYWSAYPVSDQTLADVADKAPWIAERQPVPQSRSHEGVPAGIDRIVEIVEARGIHPGYALAMPSGPAGVFTASAYPEDIDGERVIHLDQYSGEVLYDAGLADLGWFGRMAERGISIHMGQEWGRANQVVLLLACLGMIAMAIAAARMWWLRRPAGGIGAPALPADLRLPRGLLVIALVAGVLLPLVGLSMLVIAAVEIALALGARRRHPA